MSDREKKFEEWFNAQDDNSELSFDEKSFKQCYKVGYKQALEDIYLKLDYSQEHENIKDIINDELEELK